MPEKLVSVREYAPLTDVPTDEAGKYARQLYYRVHDAYRHFFPQVYVDPEIRRVSIDSPSPSEEQANDSIEPMNAAFFYPESKSIHLRTGKAIVTAETAQFDLVRTPMNTLRLRRRVVDSVGVAHEITHGIFEKISNVELQGKPPTGTIDEVLNEGHAVIMHTLFIDAVKQNPHLLQFDQTDLEHLQRYKMAYLRMIKEPVQLLNIYFDTQAFQKDPKGYMLYLKQHQTPIDGPYAEGTFRIFHRIYEEAAGPITHRDVAKGLKAIKEFISNVNRTKTLSLLSIDRQYRKILMTGSLADLIIFLSINQREIYHSFNHVNNQTGLNASSSNGKMIGITSQNPHNENSVRLDNVAQIEKDLRELPPMTVETDTMLRDYFRYVNGELQKLLGNVQFPLQFYKTEVHNMDEAKQLHDDLIMNVQELIMARGRDSTGQLGPYFWSTSDIKDLEVVFAELGTTISKVDLFPML